MKIFDLLCIMRNSRSGEGRRLDLPRYDVRYIIDRKRRDRNRHRSSSLESISGNERRRRGRSRSRGRRQRSSSSSSDNSPSLPSSPEAALLSEQRKATPRSRSMRSRSSKISISPNLNRAARHISDHRRSISPLSRRRKRSTESDTNAKISRRSPAASRKAKGQRRLARRSMSHDSDIVILPKKKSTKIVRTGESTAKKTGKRTARVTLSNTGGAGGSKPKKGKKKAALTANNKRLDISSATAAAAAASSSASASAVAGKEVYAAGNKILVSVNFKQSSTAGKKSSRRAKRGPSIDSVNNGEDMSPQHKPDSSSSAAVDRAKAKKPSLVIDIMSSPYQIFESSPKETIDLFSDEEGASGNMSTNYLRKKACSAALMTVGDERMSWSVTGSVNVPTVGQKSTSMIDPEETAQSVTSTTHALAPTVTSTSEAKFPVVPSSLASAATVSGAIGGDGMSGLSSPTALRQNDAYSTENIGIITARSRAASGGVEASTTTNTHHRGPMTPPVDDHETLDLAQGPQTPSSDMAPDSYDPFNPTTESPENRINHNTQLKPPLTMSNDDPVLKSHNGIRNSDMSLSVDMEVDSPCSPGPLFSNRVMYFIAKFNCF